MVLDQLEASMQKNANRPILISLFTLYFKTTINYSMLLDSCCYLHVTANVCGKKLHWSPQNNESGTWQVKKGT